MSDDEDEDRAQEIAFAEIENRLRGMIVELMQPTVHRTSLIAAEIENMKGLVNQHTKSINDLALTQTKAQQQVSTIDSFREEMGKWDVQRKANETKVMEELGSLKTELDGFQYNLEQKESTLKHLHRNTDRTVAELNRLQDAQTALNQLCEDRLDESSKRLNRSQAEVHTKLATLELRHNALTDELWGEETGLAKCSGELKRTNILIASLQEDVMGVKESKAEREELKCLRDEVTHLVKEANSNMGTLKQTVGNVVSDVKQHLRTATETLAAHNATFVNEVRASYREELSHAAKLRSEVEAFTKTTQESIVSVEKRVGEGHTNIEHLVAEARAEIETLNNKRKRDRAGFELEVKMLKKRLGGVFDNSDSVLKGMDRLWSVLNGLLEGERVQNALDLQDTADRKRIALVGMKDEDTLARSAQTSPQRPLQSARASQREASPTGRAKGKPVINVDTRCLSCSGQSPTVMTAFKMACLQYTPSKVEFKDRLYDREDLLGHRRNFIDRAHEELRKGKPQSHVEEEAPEPSSPLQGSETNLSAQLSPEVSILEQYATVAPWTDKTQCARLPSLSPKAPKQPAGPPRMTVSPKHVWGRNLGVASGPAVTSPRRAADVR